MILQSLHHLFYSATQSKVWSWPEWRSLTLSSRWSTTLLSSQGAEWWITTHGRTRVEREIMFIFNFPVTMTASAVSRFSGVTADDLENTTISLRDVQAVLLSMFSTDSILIGHSLESDLFALKVRPNTNFIMIQILVWCLHSIFRNLYKKFVKEEHYSKK